MSRTINRFVYVCAGVAVAMALSLSAAVFSDTCVAFAAEDIEVGSVVEVQKETVSADGLADSDQLLEDYLLKEGKEETQGSYQAPKLRMKMSSTRGSRLTGGEARLYELLKKEIDKVAAGTSTDTQFSFSYKEIFGEEAVNKKYYAEDLGLTSLAEYKDGVNYITDEACSALYEKFGIDYDKVIDALLVDEPYALYWLDKSVGFSVSYSRGPVADFDENNDLWLKINETSYYTFLFPVSQDYCPNSYTGYDVNDDGVVDPLQTDPSKSTRIKNAVENAGKVVDDYKDYSDYKKLEAYRNWICKEVAYDDEASKNTATPYGDPWQMISVFDGVSSTNVVCEGYSKAFKYLCDLSNFDKNLDCFLATGVMSSSNDQTVGAGNHMWNIIHMGDNDNYLVDVTNCDSGTIGYPDKLFMVGKKKEDGVERYDFAIVSEYTTSIIRYTYDEDTIKNFDSIERNLAESNYDAGGQTDPTDPTNPTGNTEPVEEITLYVSGIANKTYTGSPIKQAIKITSNEKITLKEGTDYEVTYKNNTNAGKATVTITGIGKYQGWTHTAYFTINPKTITPSATLNALAFTYTGKVITPRVTVKYGSKVLPASQYTITYASGRKAVGNYSVRVTLKGNYRGARVTSFNIIPRSAVNGVPIAAKKSFTARWTRQLTRMSTRQINGYQVQYSAVAGFRSGNRTINVAGAGRSSVKVGGLKAKTYYYVRVRTYMKSGARTYYSSWSAVRKVRTK